MNESDKRWITDAIRHHDRRYPTGPDSIAMSVLSARQEQFELGLTKQVSKTGVVKNSDSGRRMAISLPENLYIVLRKRYPTLFSDQKNLKWFKKTFPMFLVAEGR